jgi:diadenosine tetraphosphate (Ap4A) HIT family hydrolase
MSKVCPFCPNANRHERTLYETNLITAFFSNPRLMRGHLIVAPKRHVERLHELTPAERHDLIDVATKLQEIILAHLAQGCDLRIHYRPFQKEDGLKVNHLHAHLQPRELFDDLYHRSQKFETAIYKPLTESERTRLETLFRDIVLSNDE